VEILAAPGVITISAQQHLELNLTIDEARAIEQCQGDSVEMQSVRNKISQKLKT
jgi:hypothetical protein